jgi:hypothetical protein
MFLGHFGVGFGAKSTEPKISLGTWFLASQFVDLLWPTLLLLGVERVSIDPGNTVMTPLNFESYPITHSLLMAVVWGVLFGLMFWVVRRNTRGGLILGLCVVSHWALDLLVHGPDLPIYPGSSAYVGLGLWNSIPGTLVVELLVFGAGILLYVRTTTARDNTGTWSLWGLVGFLLLIYAGAIFGPPPDSVNAVAWVGQAQWLLVAWAYWTDRHRAVR